MDAGVNDYVASAVFVTTIIFMAIGLLLLQECQFLIPYRRVLFMKHLSAIAAFRAALFVNLLAGCLHDLPRGSPE